MQVLILNSGSGTRMGDLTRNKPKCLLELCDNLSILRFQLNIFQEFSLNNIIISTGPFHQQIEQLTTTFPGLSIKLINNGKFDVTNYIYSIYLASKFINDDVLLLHGDLVFDKEIIRELINTTNNNFVVVNNTVRPPQKDFKAIITDGLVKKITTQNHFENSFALFPIYKLSKQAFREWMMEIEVYIKNNKTGLYAEEALNNLLGNNYLLYPHYTSLFCSEIDDQDDFDKVKKVIHTILEKRP